MATALPTSGLVLLCLGQLVSPAAALNITANYTATVLEFSYQSHDIPFADWISLLTLCLAPLVAHVVAGAPEPVYLSRKRPSWQDQICTYNPTTILWRYFAIADRRLRAKAWSAATMAASNAYFWTERGWDGSEEMAHRSRSYCIKYPDGTTAKLLSGDTAKSVIVTLQGVQAFYVLVSGVGGVSFIGTVALDSIFFPLAVFGLLRLCAAFWLTDDYSYAESDANDATHSAKLDISTSQGVQLTELRPMASIGLLDPSATHIKGAFAHLAAARTFTTTTFLLVFFYLLFLSATVIIFAYYFIRGHSATTIIPCITSTWYKIYTYLLLVLVLILIVISSLETRKTPCGKYTTWPNLIAIDQQICEGLIPVVANSTQVPFGIAMRTDGSSNGTTPKGDEIIVMTFDGSCQGINWH